MIRKANAIGTAVLLAAVSCNFAQGQSPSQYSNRSAAGWVCARRP